MIKRDDEHGGWLKSTDAEVKGFTCKCDRCGSCNVVIRNSLAMGSEWTGQYGSVDLACLDCGNEAELYS